MLTRKTQYGWIVVCGILCLCGGVVALKVREGNPVAAQGEPALPAPTQPDSAAPRPLPQVVVPPGPCADRSAYGRAADRSTSPANAALPPASTAAPAAFGRSAPAAAR